MNLRTVSISRWLKKILKSPSLQTLGIFAGGNLLVAVLGGLGSLLQARLVGPEVLGELAKFGILTGYLNVGLVLVHDGLMRQFPYLLGQGNKEEALKVAAAAKWWYLFLSWLFTLFFAMLMLASVIRVDYRSAAGWGVQIPIIWLAIYGAYLGVTYRTSSEFKRLSYNRVITTVCSLCALILVKVWGYWGLAARRVLSSIMGLFISRHYAPVKVKAALDVKVLIKLAKISIPLSIPGYISSSCLSASLSFIVLKYCGQSGLGIYTTGLMLQGMGMVFFASLQQMFITKLTYKFGENGDVAACLKWAKTPTLISIAAATVLAVGLCLVIGPFIRLVLPKYEAAIPVIRILAIQLPISAAGLPLHMINTALWYKSVLALMLAQVVGCLGAVSVLPKTVVAIAACIIIGSFLRLIIGYGILIQKRCKKLPL